MRRGLLNIVIGGQAGSESKGKLSGYLVDKYKVDVVAMSASPNAGHTIVKDGVKKVSYHLPIGAIVNETVDIVLGPASLINPHTFAQEISALGINPSRIFLDERASIITPGDILDENEGKLSDIGSTLQGVGECRMGKMSRRNQNLVKDYKNQISNMNPGINIVPNTFLLMEYALISNKMILAEATQGFDLDLEHGIHPTYCTSKMINTSMVMAELGVSPRRIGDVYGVFRPYPIRVNNRTGTSGPYAEAKEITWEEVTGRSGCPYPISEITTTTKLPRRVFEFSWERFYSFCTICGPTWLCLQFANYLDHNMWGVTDKNSLTQPVKEMIKAMGNRCPVRYIGTGPEHHHMIDLYEGRE